MSSPAVRRLCKELAHIEKQGNTQLSVKPSSKNMLEWHFVLRNLPADTVYKDGQYHGKLVFPEQYPLSPPSLVMITPNGRLDINQRLCLSMTDYHPESWNPAWTVEAILVGLISFMVDEKDPKAFGVLHDSAEKRLEFARSSVIFNSSDPEFCELFPELADGADEVVECDDEVVEDAAAPSGASPASPEASSESAAPILPEVPMPVPGTTPPDDDDDAAIGDGAGVVAQQPEEVQRGECEGDATEAGATAKAGASAVDHDSEEGQREECWICREDGSSEPLIQPCACRGSMSGVHASCVEAWISHHRANALGDEVPRCSVCNQPYMGTERRPGITGFIGHLCNDFMRQALRSILLVGQLVAYWTAAQPNIVWLWLRVVLFISSGTFFLYKALVLTVSLPRGRLPPENPIARSLFTGDFRFIAVHIAESMAVVIIAGLWCATQTLDYYYFIPVCGIMMLPLVSLLFWHQGSPCSRRTLVILATILGSPLFIMIHLAKLVWQQPLRLADPSDAILHVFVALVAIPLCWFCMTNKPVIILWGVHGIVVVLGLFESTLVKKISWKEGRLWWIFVQLSVLVVYVANLLSNFSSGFLAENPNDMQLMIMGASAIWLGLACSLSFKVNWNMCVRQYRAWQHRNGTFTLGDSPTHAGSSSPSGTMLAAGLTPAPQTIGAGSETRAAEAPQDATGSPGMTGIGIVPQQPARPAAEAAEVV